jgi:ribosomal protein S18 acetylase RimI-like enzyme
MTVAEVRLTPMSEGDYQKFFDITMRDYADENIQAGYWSNLDALERSRNELLRLLPEGLRTKGHHFYTVSDVLSDMAVGHLWIRVEEGPGGRTGFIFAVYLDRDHRGRGFGTATMRALDAEAERLGLRSMALHVFAANGVAVHLYERAGYEVRSMNMVKEYRQ